MDLTTENEIGFILQRQLYNAPKTWKSWNGRTTACGHKVAHRRMSGDIAQS
jgi:hypothetical protein